MKFCRFRWEGHHFWGSIDDDGWVTAIDAAPWEPHKETGDAHELDKVELLPAALPSKIVCVGQNYRKHAEEMGKPIPTEPLIFLKPPSALNAHNKPILHPVFSQDVQHEAELAVIIGKRIKMATEDEARDALFAVSCFNDVTARDIQKREVQHTRAKGYDTFACLGPWLIPAGDLDIQDLQITCRVNGEVRQEGRTSDMVFSPARLVSFISMGMTLMPGDVISTGTPSGVSTLSIGDVVEVEIEGIGTLSNPVQMGT